MQAADNAKVTTWILNSGAVCNLTNKPVLFSSLGALEHSFASLTNGEKSTVKGEGTIYVPGLKRELRGVLLVHKLDCNTLSVSCLDKDVGVGPKLQRLNEALASRKPLRVWLNVKLGKTTLFERQALKLKDTSYTEPLIRLLSFLPLKFSKN